MIEDDISLDSLIPAQTIQWIESLIRLIVFQTAERGRGTNVSAAVVADDAAIGEQFARLQPLTADKGDKRGYALLPLAAVVSAADVPPSLEDSKSLYLSVTLEQAHTWTEQQRAGLRLAATLLAREIAHRRELVVLRRQHSDRETGRLFDEVTGLPGRDLFIDRLESAVRKASRYPDFHFAVLFLEVDQIEAVYHGLGRETADHLVRAVAERIKPLIRTEELLARSASEGFLVLLENVRDALDASRVAIRIQDAFMAPMMVDGTEIRVSASIGILLSSTGVDTADRIVALAGVARGRARQLGVGEFQIFEPKMQEQVRARLDQENELRRAVEREELEVFYQPLVALDTGKVVELEALVRWNHPRRGFLPAGAFIPLAEETELILPLGWWVIANACPQMREWQRRYPSASRLALTVNVSARHLALRDFVERIQGIVSASGLHPSSLRLEVTESMLIHDPADVRGKLSELRSGGISVYLDDFGAGYSSLRYLSELPLDGIKLDAAFVEPLTTQNAEAPIVRTVRQLARDMGVRAIAEGVETEVQLESLRALGYDMAQGYYLGRPMNVESMTAVLDRELRGAHLKLA